MGEGVDGLGEAVSGAMISRAVEPEAGEASHAARPETCLNCGAALIGDYCHACGQRGRVHRKLISFVHDFLNGLYNFEGKIWRTLPMLAWQPGELTRRYIEGERARFVSPVALFLFSVFLMFAVAGATGGVTNAVAPPEMRKELSQDIAKQEARVAELRRERDIALRVGRSTKAIDARIEANVQEIAVMSGLRAGTIRNSPDFRISDNVPAWIREPAEEAAENPDLLLYKIKTNAYKYSWALIPLSVPFLWLLFPFSRRFRFYDHTVFVIYSLSFMTLLAVVAMLLGAAGLSAVAGFLLFLPPFHMYRQLKGAYGLSRASALLRTMLLLVFTLVALVLFGLVLVALGLFD